MLIYSKKIRIETKIKWVILRHATHLNAQNSRSLACFLWLHFKHSLAFQMIQIIFSFVKEQTYRMQEYFDVLPNIKHECKVSLNCFLYPELTNLIQFSENSFTLFLLLNSIIAPNTILFLILYRRQVVPLRILPLVQCTISNSPNYLPSVQC